MKKKKIIISILLVLVLLMSAFVTVQATSGDENNIFEQLKALITGNTNRIEKLEKDVDDLENEIDKLKGEITELQKPKEEEKETQTENKDTNNNKTTTNTTSKKTTSNNTTKKTNSTTATTSNNQNKIDTLNKEIASVKKNIEELEKQDNKQTKDIENLKTELNNKSEELKELVNSNNNNSSSKVLTKKDLIGTWKMTDDNSIYTSNNTSITFNDNNTATMISNGEESDFKYTSDSSLKDGTSSIYINNKNKMKYVSNYTYTLEGQYINLTLVSATKQIVGGTKTIETKYTNGKETKETVEIKAQKPVNNPKATKKTIFTGSVINNTLYMNSLTARCVKSK